MVDSVYGDPPGSTAKPGSTTEMVQMVSELRMGDGLLAQR